MADSYRFQFRHQPFDQFITACGVDVVDVGVVSAGNAAEGVRLLRAGQFLQRFQDSLFCGVFAVDLDIGKSGIFTGDDGIPGGSRHG